MGQSGENRKTFDWAWLIIWGVLSSVWCISSASQLSATFDEATDLARGMEWWHKGTHHSLLKVGAMPLPMDVDTLPIYLWERWQGVPFDLQVDLQKPLPWARAGTLVFWWLLLIYGRLVGRQLAGPWGGRLAVALLACEPSLLAHASLATKDIAISACLLALVYHFRIHRTHSWGWRVGLPSVWFGISLLAKASGLVFGPICLFAAELERLWSQGAFNESPNADVTDGRVGFGSTVRRIYDSLIPFRRDAIQIGLLGLLVAFIYCGSDWQPEPSFIKWAHGLPNGRMGRAMIWLSEHLCIFSNAGEGLIKQITHNTRGHGVYLLGHTAPRAFWYYFPVALTIKLSIPLLALPILLVLIRLRSLLNWACWVTAALIVFSVACRVQIGIRLMLPLVSLAIVGLAGAIVNAWNEFGPGWKRGILRASAMGGVAWTAFAAVNVWPHGLCYTNEMWGGTQTGYLLLSDSNYDWGQGLLELKEWQEQKKVAQLDVWYFGTDPLLGHLPMHPFILPEAMPSPDADPLAASRGHYFAVSTTLLYGAFGLASEPYQETVAYLRSCQPVDRTQTFIIYNFTGEKPPLFGPQSAQAKMP